MYNITEVDRNNLVDFFELIKSVNINSNDIYEFLFILLERI